MDWMVSVWTLDNKGYNRYFATEDAANAFAETVKAIRVKVYGPEDY